MKRLLTTAALLCAAAAAPCTQAATINVTGRVVAGTCTFQAPTLPALAPLKASDLVPGGIAGTQLSTLEFTNCTDVGFIDLTFTGMADAAQDGNWQNTATATPATGVAVALLYGGSGTDYVKNTDTRTLTVSGDTASTQFRYGYYATVPASATAGTVSAMITVTTTYR
ncbi:fimbrial protein [Stenotrophomonas maltophilia]|uniref:Fimbrial protein n=1 Tax=Stenotrophomonas maltophilia TaxID=40324 RepID=A0A270NJY2_STEMA|nr:type 1 fimbrial protein [Stenotrophomonas maltophilia]PAM64692.1 fimbrial protein [Stenotrophomonas maltophilia]PAM71849.1 fimbrial protein [Stenotrophomonas maltophilia]PAM71858.1 fimbrial protein [Stenotrophomonas maltophilia]